MKRKPTRNQMISTSRRQKRQRSNNEYSSSALGSGQTNLDFLLLPLQVPSKSQVSLISKPQGRGFKRKWPPRLMIALLLRSNYWRSKRSWNAGKTSSVGSPSSAITFNIIRKYMAPSNPWMFVMRKTRLISFMSGSRYSKSWDANTMQNVGCPLSESCCMKAHFFTQGWGSER